MFTSFIAGFLSASFAYALFSDVGKFRDDDEPDAVGKRVVMSCQSCRKLTRHVEVEPYLFECVKCKRTTDLRVVRSW